MERSLSAVEVCNHLLGFNMEFSNVPRWTFIYLNTLYWTMFRHWTSFRQRALSKTQAKDLPDMVNITQTGRKISAIEAYKARGPLLRHFCLYDYLACVEIQQKGGSCICLCLCMSVYIVYSSLVSIELVTLTIF